MNFDPNFCALEANHWIAEKYEMMRLIDETKIIIEFERYKYDEISFDFIVYVTFAANSLTPWNNFSHEATILTA